MSSLRIPGLGPIVGHTTDDRCHLWIRACDPDDQSVELSPSRRTIGIITVIKENGKVVKDYPIYYFRLHREYDRTGTFLLGNDHGICKDTEIISLKPDTKYSVRIATLTIDDPSPEDASIEDDVLLGRLPDAETWRTTLLDLDQLEGSNSVADFKTFPVAGDISAGFGFILGSCRFPGFFWRAKHADRIFEPIANQIKRKNAPKFVLMVGDQIYADKLNKSVPVGRADTFEEFQERYHSAFGSRNMRNLLSSVPNYMILDDHEIEDNWTQDRFDDGSRRQLFVLAMNAYMSYQWCHGPRTYGTHLYYTFECGDYPFFVLDTRTQRYMRPAQPTLDDNHLLGRPALGDEPTQLGRLLDWLTAQQASRGNIPKFVVSSSVFAPNPIDARQSASKESKESSDSWPGYPTTKQSLLSCIVDNGIQNVVFLSGDIHCSNVAKITYAGAAKVKDLKTFSITSSAFYWPFPFADGDPSNYVHDSTKDNQRDTFVLNNGTRVDYTADNFTQSDNFCRIDIDREKHQIKVRAYDRQGDLVVERTQAGKKKNIETRLNLVTW